MSNVVQLEWCDTCASYHARPAPAGSRCLHVEHDRFENDLGHVAATVLESFEWLDLPAEGSREEDELLLHLRAAISDALRPYVPARKRA